MPLLEVYIGSEMSVKHDVFRELMLEKKVRVKFINHSEFMKSYRK